MSFTAGFQKAKSMEKPVIIMVTGYGDMTMHLMTMSDLLNDCSRTEILNPVCLPYYLMIELPVPITVVK